MVVDAIHPAFHHRPNAAGAAKKLAAAVCVGNALAHIFEHPAENSQVTNPELQSAMTQLGLGSKHMELYDQQMQENWEFVNTLIQTRLSGNPL